MQPALTQITFQYTGTPPLTRFFGTQKNRVKGKPSYRRTFLVLKQENGPKSTFSKMYCM